MLKNYLTIALRNLYKRKGYTFINMAGLALGMTCFLLILFFVRYEFSYDRFYPDADRIHRVTLHQPGNVYLGTDNYAVTPPPLASVLRDHYPDVSTATSLRNRSALLSQDNKHFWEDGIWADAHFFDVFSIPLLQGQTETALQQPNSIVLTEGLARKIFGRQDPLNQVITVGGSDTFTVTGLVADPPRQSSIKYNFITSILSHADYARRIEENLWGSSNVHTFVRFTEDAKAADFEAKLPALVETYRYRGVTDIPPENRDQFFLQSLADVHLGPFLNFDIGFQGETQNGVKGNRTFIYLFMAVGLIILLLACINYMNLAIARSIKRAQEVGLRKVVGAQRTQIIGQFLSESILISALALLVALALVELLIPYFSEMVNRPVQSAYSEHPLIIAGLFLLILIVGLVAGSYPALFISALKPIEVLKGKMAVSRSRFNLRQALIVGQYTASIALIACGFVIYQQLDFIRNKDLGYELDHIVTLPIQQDNDALRYNFDRIENEWLRISGVSAVTASASLPVYTDWQAEISGWEGSTDDEVLQIYLNPVQYNYFDMYGIEMAAGRAFSEENTTDAVGAAIINETAARTLGWTPAEALGKQFIEGRGQSIRTVVGVTKDFHAHSMHLEIRPYVFYIADERADYASSVNYFAARIQGANIEETLDNMRTVVAEVSPYPASFRFLDDQFDQLYKADRSLGQTIAFFTLLAFLIASMGLFGLAAFAAEQRTKEVGIRKVLGASEGTIVTMLIKEFTGLVMLAALLATPIAYFVMQRWLEGFVYRITIGPEIFVVTVASSLLIAVLTVGNQTLKAALADPVKSLRYE